MGSMHYWEDMQFLAIQLSGYLNHCSMFGKTSTMRSEIFPWYKLLKVPVFYPINDEGLAVYSHI